MAKLIDEAGNRYGRLTVVGLSTVQKGSAPLWYCSCDCGGSIDVPGSPLRKGKVVGCGCVQRERSKAANTTHGAFYSHPAEYRAWSEAKRRCFNANAKCYPRYGGRGITMCDEWKSDFSAFLRDLGPRPTPEHSLDRIDNNGDYRPGNCRWATAKEQNRNKRSNRLVTIDGVTIPMVTACEYYGQDQDRVHARLKYLGWSVEKALKTPSRSLRSNRR